MGEEYRLSNDFVRSEKIVGRKVRVFVVVFHCTLQRRRFLFFAGRIRYRKGLRNSRVYRGRPLTSSCRKRRRSYRVLLLNVFAVGKRRVGRIESIVYSLVRRTNDHSWTLVDLKLLRNTAY